MSDVQSKLEANDLITAAKCIRAALPSYGLGYDKSIYMCFAVRRFVQRHCPNGTGPLFDENVISFKRMVAALLERHTFLVDLLLEVFGPEYHKLPLVDDMMCRQHFWDVLANNFELGFSLHTSRAAAINAVREVLEYES